MVLWTFRMLGGDNRQASGSQAGTHTWPRVSSQIWDQQHFVRLNSFIHVKQTLTNDL